MKIGDHSVQRGISIWASNDMLAPPNAHAHEAVYAAVKRWDVLDLARKFSLGNHKIISALEIDPQIRTVAAQLAESQRHPGRRRLLLSDNVIEGLPRDAEQARNLGLGFAERRQDVLAEHLTGMHRSEAT